MKKVITISSGAGDLDATLWVGSTVPVGTMYSISKAAVNMAMAKYACQYKAEGFVFLSLSPGLVNTTGKSGSLNFMSITRAEIDAELCSDGSVE